MEHKPNERVFSKGLLKVNLRDNIFRYRCKLWENVELSSYKMIPYLVKKKLVTAVTVLPLFIYRVSRLVWFPRLVCYYIGENSEDLRKFYSSFLWNHVCFRLEHSLSSSRYQKAGNGILFTLFFYSIQKWINSAL